MLAGSHRNAWPDETGTGGRTNRNTQGLNVVLFHKSSRVEHLELPEGCEIEAETGYFSEEGWEVDYSVKEQIPAKKSPEADDDEPHFPDFNINQIIASDADSTDLRKSTLSVDLEAISVCSVRSVQYQFEEHGVPRFQYEKTDKKF